ncbi:hypothetical protein [Mucilaginibacter myungsuensis]|uniref:Lipocalin-like protein n=1 Tax=Mucilaginibacter myungsuensis TaxID=649104 RepID=A0A929KXZ7_9SPHI|nr:hypothetical protein [Mucilaginibacter myungsuensis]MBE9663237.1 hypothetical protein [Mucilaginibacter myungsuensis]MDN3598870.1 hypothetical protein [Mucilaginibacter myungsuensis]
MKKNLLLLAALSSLFYVSCKKEDFAKKETVIKQTLNGSWFYRSFRLRLYVGTSELYSDAATTGELHEAPSYRFNGDNTVNYNGLLYHYEIKSAKGIDSLIIDIDASTRFKIISISDDAVTLHSEFADNTLFGYRGSAPSIKATKGTIDVALARTKVAKP